MAKQTPFNKIVRPSERESLLMEYAVKRQSAINWLYRLKASARLGYSAVFEMTWARQDAAECRKIWKEIQAL